MIEQTELYEMALAGYALRRAAIEQDIERVRLLLAIGDRPAEPLTPAERAKVARYSRAKRKGARPSRVLGIPRPARKLSAAGRAAIIAATKKRWAKYRRAKSAATGFLKKLGLNRVKGGRG